MGEFKLNMGILDSVSCGDYLDQRAKGSVEFAKRTGRVGIPSWHVFAGTLPSPSPPFFLTQPQKPIFFRFCEFPSSDKPHDQKKCNQAKTSLFAGLL